MSSFKLWIRNAQQVVQVVNNHTKCVIGKEAMNDLKVLQADDSGGVSVIIDNSGNIADVDMDACIINKYGLKTFESVIEATGMTVIPGLVDAHTHPVWTGDRVQEFAMKLAGATYMEIHESGGGIHYTVERTREADESELRELLLKRLNLMLRSGTTLVEAKSGYGLDLPNELKLLRVIDQARDHCPIEISSTFCGAHAVPEGKNSKEATEEIVKDHIPEIGRQIRSGKLRVDSIDVFCEKGVFEVEDARRILEAGRQVGLRLNFHGDELNACGAAEMGAELNAEAISHLEEISDQGIAALAKSQTAAIILPTTAFTLRLPSPPVRKMIDQGAIVALGTDFNPNAYCFSMPLVMSLACVLFRMTMSEALMAATINSAFALGKSATQGSLEVGKMADMVIIDAPRWEHLIYQLGCHDHLIKKVIKGGNVVFDNCVDLAKPL